MALHETTLSATVLRQIESGIFTIVSISAVWFFLSRCPDTSWKSEKATDQWIKEKARADAFDVFTEWSHADLANLQEIARLENAVTAGSTEPSELDRFHAAHLS